MIYLFADEFCLKSSTSQDFMYVSVGTNPPSMLAVNPSGQRIITSYSLASNVPVLAFAYTIDTTFQPPQLLEVQTTTNSAAGWFVCGDQVTYCVDDLLLVLLTRWTRWRFC